MIRCVGAALRGDGNPPEVPVIHTVLRAYNGVWECPHQAHECRFVRTNAVLARTTFCEAKYSETISPERAL